MTEALEAEGEARFLALTTPLTDAAAGDRPARDREVRLALALLPGLPESQTVPLLKQIGPWVEQARLSQGQRASLAETSEIASRINARDAYKAIWEYYGDADCDKLLPACRRLWKLPAEPAPESERRRRRIEGAVFDALEYAIHRRLTAGDGARVSKARRLLDQADSWKTNPRWQALDAVVQEQERAGTP